jgi:thiamine-phosphate pyrophosphorylase
VNISDARWYLCIGLVDDLLTRVEHAVRGGIDIVQLRDKTDNLAALHRQGRDLRALCRDLDVPFIVNDSPELAVDLDADGVHVGQDDVSIERCRLLLGSAAIVGLSTHAPSEFTAGLDTSATYLSAGPIEATPTKPGREGTGRQYATWAQAESDRPVFVTGGVNERNVGELVRAGLRHFVVVRAITESPDPQRSARALVDAYEAALA